MEKVVESNSRLNITATNATIKYGSLMGIFVSQASSSPTIKVEDQAGTIANTFTPLAGSYYPLPCDILGILTVTIGGTVDATVFYA